MSNISVAFENKKALAGFVTAGDPSIEISEEILISMAKAGLDFIVLGIPFSDPIAEDVIVQDANIRSLQKGTHTDEVFSLVKRVTGKVSVPVVLKSYLNVLFKYGYDNFLKKAKDSGVSSVLVPDMPFEEQKELENVAKNYDIEVISAFTTASGDRIKMISKNASGFLCEFVSNNDKADKENIISSVKLAKENGTVPVVLNVDAVSEEEVSQYINLADGVIIDTELVRITEKSGNNAPQEIYNFIKSIKNSI